LTGCICVCFLQYLRNNEKREREREKSVRWEERERSVNHNVVDSQLETGCLIANNYVRPHQCAETYKAINRALPSDVAVSTTAAVVINVVADFCNKCAPTRCTQPASSTGTRFRPAWDYLSSLSAPGPSWLSLSLRSLIIVRYVFRWLPAKAVPLRITGYSCVFVVIVVAVIVIVIMHPLKWKRGSTEQLDGCTRLRGVPRTCGGGCC